MLVHYQPHLDGNSVVNKTVNSFVVDATFRATTKITMDYLDIYFHRHLLGGNRGPVNTL